MIIATWPEHPARGAVSAFCREHGISRSRFYEIRDEAARHGPVKAVSAKPRTRPDLKTAPAVEAAAVRLRTELAASGWDHGPISVRHAMLAAGLPAPSVATLARIFTRNGLVTPAPRKRPHVTYRRFVFEQVHQCWQLDATQWRLAGGGPAVVFQLLDDHSRFIVASVVASGETSAAALEVFQAAVTRFQAPVLLLSDNGLAMNPHRRGRTSDLASLAASLGTRPITSRIYHPQTCGKNERVHATLKRFLRAQPRPATLDELRALVAGFDDQYNHHRPHQALGMRVPAGVLATGPQATPPAPPAPPAPLVPPASKAAAPQSLPHPIQSRAPGSPPRPGDRLSQHKVAASGAVKAGGVFIGLGTEHAGQHVLALIEPPHITLFDQHGTHLRSIQTVPGTNYYGTGRKRSGRRQPAPATSTISPSN